MKILQFIKSLVPYLHKSDVLEDIRLIKSELELTTLMALNQAAEHFKLSKIKSTDAQSLVSSFYRNYDLASQSASVNIAAELTAKIKIVLENLVFIEHEFEKIVNSDIVAEGITVKKAILIRAIDQINFISKFSLDLLTLIYSYEAIAASKEDKDVVSVVQLTKQFKTKVATNIAVFARLVTTYGDKKFSLEKRFENIPDVVVNDRTVEAVVATYDEKKVDPYSTPLISGFYYNPIYHIRLNIAEWQANRYKAMKDKKKSLELRLLHLQMLQESKNDPKLEQEIVYLQNRIDKYEYSISKMEHSVE